jgi:hypothetical protein
MVSNPHETDVYVNILLPPGPGDMMLVSVTPRNAHVKVPMTGKDSTITWKLSGLPPTISGLEFTDDGIEMVGGWDDGWGTPQQVSDTVWTLTVKSTDAPTPSSPFKYIVRIAWDAGSAQIDPEIEFDPDS